MLLRALCVLLFLGLTAERNGDPLLYNFMWRSPLAVFAPLFDSLPLVHQPAWNVLLEAMVPICFIKPGAFRRRAWPMDAAIGASLVSLAFGVLWGAARGGSAYYAYYQLNALLLGLGLALLLLATIRSPGDVRVLGATVLAAALTRAALALYFFFAFVRGHEPYPPLMTSHDDSPLFAAGLFIAIAWAIATRRWRSWLLAAVALIPLLLAMKVNNRRMVWFEVGFGILLLFLLLPRGRLRRNVHLSLLVLVPVCASYVSVGWGRQGALFTPLRAFDSTTGENEDASTKARNEENLNLVLNYIQHPIMGTGWGHGFFSVSSFYANFGGGFDTMYRYIPHNSLAALAAFSGFPGLIGVLGVVPVAAFLGARACGSQPVAIERAGAMAAVAFLPAYLAHAYGDIGLQSVTNGLLLGAALGVVGRVSVSAGGWPGHRVRQRRGHGAVAT